MADTPLSAGSSSEHSPRPKPIPIPLLRIVFSNAITTPEILNYPYRGAGTLEDPYICELIPDDPVNPQAWSPFRHSAICLAAATTTFVVSFCSSAYVPAVPGIRDEFGVSEIVAVLGLALYLIGYVIGPLVWGPFSELYGRRYVKVCTLGKLTDFGAGAAGAKNIQTLLVCRIMGSIFGSSPLTTSGGIIADLVPASRRGIPVAVFSIGPFLGPALGPSLSSRRTCTTP